MLISQLLAEPLRNAYIPDILAKIPQDRLLFGSDYPIPPSEFSYKKGKNIIKWIKLTFEAFSIRNPLDKNYYLLKKMGFDSQIFKNNSKLLGQIKIRRVQNGKINTVLKS